MRAFSVAEKLANAAGRDVSPHDRTPRYDWLQSMLRIAQVIEERTAARFNLQDTAETRCIMIDVLGPPRQPPADAAHLSYGGGPLTPVRILDKRRDDPTALDALQMAVASAKIKNESGLDFSFNGAHRRNVGRVGARR
jgi:hypothetical protein